MLKLSDLCPGDPYGPEGQAPTHCSCGLPWDPDRGRHTRSGIRIPDDVYSRILAREGNALDVEETRKAFVEADSEKRSRSPEAIAMRALFGLRFVRGRR